MILISLLLLAMGVAERNNNMKLAVKSLFIKTKAVQNLEDWVRAFPLAVACKHLRPEVSNHPTYKEVIWIIVQAQKGKQRRWDKCCGSCGGAIFHAPSH